MKENVVIDGLNVEELLQSLHGMLSAGIIDKKTVIVLDAFDGYRHGIRKVVLEDREMLTISAKLHEEVC